MAKTLIGNIKGPKGDRGADGVRGVQGPAGATGATGPQGLDGDSAYQIAVNNGFEGSEEDWLASLEGGTFVGTITGTIATATDSTDAPIISLKSNGYTEQDGTPTPDAPIEIEGLDKVSLKTCGKNLLNYDEWKKATCKNGSVVWENNGVTITALQDDAYTQYYHDEQNDFPSKINVIEGEEYTLSWEESSDAVGHIYVFGQNNKVIAFQENEKAKKVTFTIPSGITQISYRFGVINANVTIFYKNIQIEKGDTATPYAPYTETLAEIDLTDPLYEGDYIEYRADGTGVLHRKMAKVVFDGSSDEDWRYSTSDSSVLLLAILQKPCKSRYTGKERCSHYPTAKTYWNTVPDKTCGFIVDARNQFAILDSSYSDVASWKTWLQSNPVTVVYELATPQEIELTAEQLAQFKQLRTFEPITNVLCDGETVTQYYKNSDSGECVAGLQERVDNITNALNEKAKKDGSNASGTWGIDITGNAETSTKATQDGSGNVITETYVKKKPKMIVLTDSYGVVNGNNSWCYKFASFLGLTLNQDIFIKAVESTGFTSNCPYTFLGNLNQMSIEKPDDITDIVVCGGLNDVHYNTVDSILSIITAIESFVSTCKTKFPNAQVHIGFIGNALSKTYIENKIIWRKHPIPMAINLYKNCTRYGARYLNGVEYLLRNICLFHTDMVHPNVDGAYWIANGVANAFLSGSTNVTGMNDLGLTVSNDLKTTGLVGCNLVTFIDNSTCGIILDVQDGVEGQISCYPNTRTLPSTKDTMYDFELGTFTNSYVAGVLNKSIKTSLYCKVSLYTSANVNSQVLLPCTLNVKNNKLYISFIVPESHLSGKINGFVVEPCQITCSTLNN